MNMITITSPPPRWIFHPLTPLELNILIMLLKRPSNGYCLAQDINVEIMPVVRATPSGTRRALTRLQRKGLIEITLERTSSGRQEQYYELTDLGHTHIKNELERIEVLLDLAENYLTLTPYIR